MLFAEILALPTEELRAYLSKLSQAIQEFLRKNPTEDFLETYYYEGSIAALLEDEPGADVGDGTLATATEEDLQNYANFLISELDYLDEEDFFGTSGWRQELMGETS